MNDMPPDEQLKYINSEYKINIFRALQRVAMHVDRQSECEALLHKIPGIADAIRDESTQPVKFYWGGGRWV